MSIKIYKRLIDIPGHFHLQSNLPPFGTQEYADLLLTTEGVKTYWLLEAKLNYTNLIVFCIKEKIFYKRGFFNTAVISTIEQTVEEEKRFLNDVIRYIAVHKLVDWVQQGPNWALFRTVPDGSVYCKFGTYIKELENLKEDELFKTIVTKDRQDINCALRNGVEVTISKKISKSQIDVINATAIRAGQKTQTDEYFNTLLSTLSAYIVIFSATYNNIVQCATIFLYDRDRIYAYRAGSIERQFRGANSLLYWEVFKWARNEGIMIFDFVGARINPLPGSKQERIQHFKKHFGVKLETGYLWKIILNKFKYCLFRMLQKTIYFLKRQELKLDIIDQERNG